MFAKLPQRHLHTVDACLDWCRFEDVLSYFMAGIFYLRPTSLGEKSMLNIHEAAEGQHVLAAVVHLTGFIMPIKTDVK